MSPGDEVICVATVPMCPNCDNQPIEGDGFRMPEVGARYIVGMVSPSGFCSRCHHEMPVMRPAGSALPYPWAWRQHWFRPLEYDEDEHVREAGVRLPVRILEPVS